MFFTAKTYRVCQEEDILNLYIWWNWSSEFNTEKETSKVLTWQFKKVRTFHFYA